MNNYVSKEVAIKLKEAGFDMPTGMIYEDSGRFCFGGIDFHNTNSERKICAPDFLTAADWIFQNLSLEIIFSIYKTKVFSHVTGEYLKICGGDGFDHRNEALLFALTQIKTKA